MNPPQAGQTVYGILFRWFDGSESWAAVLDGYPGFAPAVDSDRTTVFCDGNDAHAFLGAYAPLVQRCARVVPCELQELPEDE